MDLRHPTKVILKLNGNSAEIAMEPEKKERAKSQAVEQNSTMLTVQVLWGCQAYSATPEETAKRVVADLFEQLSQGGSVSVHVEESDGKEYRLEVTAKRQ